MNRVCLITGGTSGIGLAAAHELASRDFHLVLVGRCVRRGADVARHVSRRNPGADVQFLKSDLSSMEEVRSLAEAITRTHRTLDLLINNAGARFDRYGESADGIERTFATNHLGHFLLTHLLLDSLKRSEAGRIITVSSGAHRSAMGDGRWQMAGDSYDRKQAYAKSKLANILFAFELGRRLEGTSVTSNAVDPGVVATRFALNNGMVAWAKHNLSHLARGELRSPAKGADTVVWLASDPEAGRVSGRLFRDRQAIVPSTHALNRDLASRLWEDSARLVGLGPDPTPDP